MSVPEDYPDADRVADAFGELEETYEHVIEVCEEEALTLLANTLKAHKGMATRLKESVQEAKRADSDVHFNVDESAIPESEG